MEFILEKINMVDTWVYQLFAVVLVTLVVKRMAMVFLKGLERRLKKTKNPWDDIFIEALLKPVAFTIWVVGFSFAAQLIFDQWELNGQGIQEMRELLTILLSAWFLVRFIRGMEEGLIHPKGDGKPIDATTVHAIGKLLRMSVIITVALVAVQNLGYNITGVLAFGGIGGIAVGFAAKDLLANFFGGLMIYLDRPFRVGDWIRSPDQEIEGTVEYVGWRQTRIRTFDKRPLYVPNSTFASISVENPSRMQNRRIYETIGLRYEDSAKLQVILEDVRSYLGEHDEIDPKATLIVNFNSFGASSLDFFIYTFTKTTDWVRFHQIKQDILLDIMQIVQRHGADMAFPTRTLHIASPEPDFLGPASSD